MEMFTPLSKSIQICIHRFLVADAVAKRIINHTVMEYYTDPQRLVALHVKTGELIALGPRAHVGAHYLTGNARENISEELVQANLGRLGTWIRAFQPNSTLVKSPALTEEAIQSYEDFDANFRIICNAVKNGLTERMQKAAGERAIDWHNR